MPTKARQLSVSITAELSRFIQREVKSGRYSSASEVVRDALRHMDQHDILQERTEPAGPQTRHRPR
jgi:putative addiction module CopG family antidote